MNGARSSSKVVCESKHNPSTLSGPTRMTLGYPCYIRMSRLTFFLFILSATMAAQLNVKDYGVDCTGASDSSGALNALFTNITHQEVDFPSTCQVRVDHPVVVFGQSSFVLKGFGNVPGPGGFGGPSIFGCNGSSGPVLYINRSMYGRIEGLGIYPRGPASLCSSNFTGSIQIDNTGSGGVTGHKFILDYLSLTTSPQGGTISGYKGLLITGATNNEQIAISNSWIHCQRSSGSIAIDLEGSDSDNDKAYNNDLAYCYIGIKHNAGNMRVQGNMFSGVGAFSIFGAGGAAIFIGAQASGPINIEYNEETDSGPFINSANDQQGVGGAGALNVIGNVISISDMSTSAYAINLGTTGGYGSSVPGAFIFIGNDVFITQRGVTKTVIGSDSQGNCKWGPLGKLIDIANTNHFPANTAGWSGCAGTNKDFQQGHIRLGSPN
jgi:hypothetical protein